MARRAAGLIFVLDASTFVSAALKRDIVPERAVLRMLCPPKRLIMSAPVERE